MVREGFFFFQILTTKSGKLGLSGGGENLNISHLYLSLESLIWERETLWVSNFHINSSNLIVIGGGSTSHLIIDWISLIPSNIHLDENIIFELISTSEREIEMEIFGGGTLIVHENRNQETRRNLYLHDSSSITIPTSQNPQKIHSLLINTTDHVRIEATNLIIEDVDWRTGKLVFGGESFIESLFISSQEKVVYSPLKIISYSINRIGRVKQWYSIWSYRVKVIS